MKRALEVLLVAAALFLAGFVTLRVLSRRAPPVEPAPSASQRAGRDEEDPHRPAKPEPYARAVQGVPMIKLDHPPRRRHLKTDIPTPAARP